MASLPRRFEPLFAFVVGAALGLGGCAASPAVEAARARDFARLEKEIGIERQRGELDASETADIAQAIGEGEIRVAKSDAELDGFSSCAEPLEDALWDRYDRGDDAGASAASVLLSNDLADADDFVHLARERSAKASYVAVGARSLVEEEDFVLRRSLYRDGDERVRVGALRAAMISPAADDVAALFEAARHDPLPSARSVAARALGRVGGKEAARRLRELWDNADDRLRQAIADGLSQAPTFTVGGYESLLWAAQHQNGEGAISAALPIVQLIDSSRPEYGVGLGVLVRAIRLGTRPERVFAMSAAPSTPSVVEALKAAETDSDPAVAIAALGRLMSEAPLGQKRPFSDKLFVIAKTDDPESARAREELARIGDARVVPLLEKDLKSKNPFARTLAARAFLAMRRYDKVAPSLADRDERVRADIACAILAADD